MKKEDVRKKDNVRRNTGLPTDDLEKKLEAFKDKLRKELEEEKQKAKKTNKTK